MSYTISTIDDYIAHAPIIHQQKLHALRNLIMQCAPATTTETISYQMPTFRYHGNLIHFAIFKKHIGIYPGAAAIDAFAEELKPYKTSKGAFQIPLDIDIPEALIASMIEYNAHLLQEKKGPQWHNSRDQWTEAYEFMNALIVTLPLVKIFKWSTEVYTYEDKHVIAWGGFKNFFSLWFYHGVFLEDKAQVLIAASKGKTKSLRQWRFDDIAALKANEKNILAYIEESIQTIKDGKQLEPQQPEPLVINDFLQASLALDDALFRAFNQLTLAKQRDYSDYIAQAKQEATKIKRLAKITPMILAGVGLNDRYKK